MFIYFTKIVILTALKFRHVIDCIINRYSNRSSIISVLRYRHRSHIVIRSNVQKTLRSERAVGVDIFKNNTYNNIGKRVKS